MNLQSQDLLNVIPYPYKIEKKEGYFELNKNTRIIIDSDDKFTKIFIEQFADIVSKFLSSKIPIFKEKKFIKNQNTIVFLINQTSSEINGEEYILQVEKNSIILESSTPAGLFYGLQTIYQLLPNKIYSNKIVQDHDIKLPCLKIIDKPRFKWRGLMLDVSRHFFDKEFVKKYIDMLATYKMNIFHWHLTDDQGWRIEIKSLPKLMEIGAWRVPRLGTIPNRKPPEENELSTYGGYYTQEEIKEIVKYAKERFITIVPEIDIPGHSLAAIAAYPEYSCTGKQYKVNPLCGFYGEIDNALCAGNEEVFTFLDKIFTEVATIFDSPYIHIGGDECLKEFWKKCPKCQQRIKDEKLNNFDELQSYFIKRVEKILSSKGKKIIGWDEILEGGLAPDATVMSWRGIEGGIKAAQMNHNVIMSPFEYCYLDLYQGDPSLEPPTYSMCRLSTTYSFDPASGIPVEQQKFILGGQGNLWTESVPTTRHAEYMTWPRAFALSEVLWSPKESKNWDDFTRRVDNHFQKFDIIGIKYAKSIYDISFKPVLDKGSGKLSVELFAEVNGLDIFFSFDNTDPDNFYPLYKQLIEIPKGAEFIKAIAYRNGAPIGKLSTKPTSDFRHLLIEKHKAVGKIVMLKFPFKKYNAGGEGGLVNGFRGEKKISAADWQGFEGTDFEAIVDLENIIDVSKITVGFLKSPNQYVFFPINLEYFISEDGINYKNVAKFEYPINVFDRELSNKDFEKNFQTVKARYIKIVAESAKKCPEGHPAAGEPSWLFVDEIIVK